jgi:hypothetical protein
MAMALPLAALTRWYAAHCDGAHRNGISIHSTDSLGWRVTIDLRGTALEYRLFTAIAEGVDADGRPKAKSWLHCRVRNGTWHGSGDETRLDEILRRFLDWATDRAS